MKSVIVLRATSGNGKSTFAEYLKSLHKDVVICCADNYFETSKGYQFDVTKLGEAHAQCYNKFRLCVDTNAECIVVANTNTSEKEFIKYDDYAKANGYMVFHLVMENRHGNKDIHNVPSEALENQRAKLLKKYQNINYGYKLSLL